MFGPKVLETVISPINGRLEVRKWGKDIYVTAAGLTQSGGLVKDIWQSVLKQGRSFKVGPFEASWLILGLGCGTVAKIISQKYSPTQIVGVEIDPVMLEIGQRYFALDQIPNLEVIQQDALHYVLQATGKFDFVLVDLYLGDQLPEFVYQKKFLEQLGKLGQLVIVNHLFYDADKKTKAKILSNQLAKIFPHILLVRELTNLLIICSQKRV